MRILYFLIFLAGCRHCQTSCPKANPVKWSSEGCIGTSVYPNAPYRQHEYLCEKVDLSIKLRREW